MEDRRMVDRALDAQYQLAHVRRDSEIVRTVNRALLDPEGQIAKSAAAVANAATTYAVSTEMTEMVAAAAEGLLSEWTDGDTLGERLLETDVPSPVGFVHFAHHIDLMHMLPLCPDTAERGDFEPKPIGFMWTISGPADDGILNFFPFFSPDYWAHLQDQFNIQRTTPGYAIYDLAGWVFDRPWKLDPTKTLDSPKDEYDEHDNIVIPGLAGIDRAILYSFFRLVDQRIPQVSKRMPSRAALRRVKAKRPQLSQRAIEDGGLRVVSLRKERTPSHGEGGHGDVEWSHRWFVQGHWAKRRVATRDAEGKVVGTRSGIEGKDWTYRRVWINPYIKGPESKPVALKETVNVLRR